MHPILFVIPVPFSETKILIYSVFFSITVSLVLAIYLGTRAAQKQGLPVETALNMTFFGLIALILGARFYAFLENPSFYFAHPLRLIKLWEGSLATYGGAIGGVLGCLTYLLVKRQPVFRYLDAYGPYGFLGIAIIRFGDFLNGTAFLWGVSFPKESFAYNYHLNHGWISSDALVSLPVHPSQLYSTIICLLIFGLLLFRIHKGKKFHGEIFLVGGMLYSGARFCIDFFRDDLTTNLPWQFSSTQWVGIMVFLILFVFYLVLLWKNQRNHGA